MNDREMLEACLAAMKVSNESAHGTDWTLFIRDLNQHLRQPAEPGVQYAGDPLWNETRCQHDLLKPDPTVTVTIDEENKYMSGRCSACGHSWNMPWEFEQPPTKDGHL